MRVLASLLLFSTAVLAQKQTSEGRSYLRDALFGKDKRELHEEHVCSANAGCAGLEGMCCPTEEGVHLDCCNQDNRLCENIPTCNALGLTGECCKTVDGVVLDCCLGHDSGGGTGPGSGYGSCENIPECNVLGLTGDCCVTVDGVTLDCCLGLMPPPAPSPGGTSPTSGSQPSAGGTPTIGGGGGPAACANNPTCSNLALTGDCCPTSAGFTLDCCLGLMPPPAPPASAPSPGSPSAGPPSSGGGGSPTPGGGGGGPASCANYEHCVTLGLFGDCCPSNGVMLDCCSTTANSPSAGGQPTPASPTGGSSPSSPTPGGSPSSPSPPTGPAPSTPAALSGTKVIDEDLEAGRLNVKAYDNGDKTATYVVTYQGNEWIGLGVSPTDAMVPSQAVIALPDSGQAPEIYDLTSQQSSGVVQSSAVVRAPQNEQILKRSSVVQQGGVTTLTYTVPLDSPTPYSISSTTATKYYYVVGSGSGSGNQITYPITWRTITAAAPVANGGQPTPTGPAPTPPTGPSPTPPSPTGPAPTSPTPPTPTGPAPTPLSPTSTPGTEVTDGLFLQAVDNGDKTATYVVTYQGQGWIAFGVSPPNDVLPAQTVIGLPDASSAPQIYDVSPSGVEPAAASDQILKSSSCRQANGVTTLIFTAPLDSPTPYSISSTTDTKYYYAVGSGNQITYPINWGTFTAAPPPSSGGMTPTGPSPTPPTGPSPTPPAPTPTGPAPTPPTPMGPPAPTPTNMGSGGHSGPRPTWWDCPTDGDNTASPTSQPGTCPDTPPPPIDCDAYESQVLNGYKRMCHSTDPCCYPKRSSTRYCKNFYDNVFPGSLIYSACYHCCPCGPLCVGNS